MVSILNHSNEIVKDDKDDKDVVKSKPQIHLSIVRSVEKPPHQKIGTSDTDLNGF
jgi:hypothetical protein